MKIASCVVLYHPEIAEVKRNINSYIDSVDKLYVIDNTPNPFSESKELINLSNKIEYLPNYDNLGIATALNIACKKAIQDNFNWIITFDQDSFCFPDTIDKLKETCKNHSFLGCISPIYIEAETNIDKQLDGWKIKKNIIEVNCVITSCCLTNLEAYNKVGGFDESFFIDLVDTDFCFKMKESGYKVMITNNTFFKHSLGSKNTANLGRYIFFYSNHSPIRRYYITRNRLIFRKRYKQKYPDFCNRELKQMTKEAVKILLFEDKKTAKVKAMIYGFLDFSMGISGKTNREF